ncbi:MAG TPA: 1,4-dihydroxy-2-naphthoate octaprenyltransferase [Anaerohalosphaeraceae bacterium]|nr:1,4-dihydroxy-2-naphthoate octaprenyltransferase [Phycisphaerae bacterium]HOK95383.1 1,4-dihydroxy-2-naphthoate octaprenyltransferase [Anaerohalosphaeraceae bacterium]HOL32217.1 1,4-dihydroxy-2-naphthoate octaprenyltransferase [Anaerohalosphaeraceae bacterium]HOM75604.1 1,4-dihydroxy-2-naphthoate octaprenyltransferase [Anaerohalosphaeraceae bacterium]HPC63532.1 1,4-dihydroxy-2-naphthoate octaprenyltransferase [Anaerohalosphaeraceae bacterium]
MKLSLLGWRCWLRAARPFSWTASMTPVLLGAALVPYLQKSGRWLLLPFIAAASLFMHAATNMVNEYFDYKKGVDTPDSFGGSRILVDGLLSPKQVLAGGLVLYALTVCIGLIFIVFYGWPILLLGLIGLAGGFFYSALPIGYKYRGLGDPFVFILMGPLMVIGSFFVLTGAYQTDVLLISLPIGCLVTAILSANNLRDIQHDTQAGIRTTASVLTHRWARAEYAGLVMLAYLITLTLMGLKILPLWSLLTFPTLLLAVRTVRAAWRSRLSRPEQIAALDVQTAQLHLLFGMQLIFSVLLGAFL